MLLHFHADETEEQVPDGVFRALKSILIDLGIDCKVWKCDPIFAQIVNEPILVLGKPHPDVHADSMKGTIVPGPSIAQIMGTPHGLERLRRSVRLWHMVTTNTVEDPLYEYDLVEPNPNYTGSLPGYTSMMLREMVPMLQRGYSKMVVDIETSGDIKTMQPGDTDAEGNIICDLISVAILFERKSDPEKYDIAVWTKDALQDPYCQVRLAATLLAGVPRTMHNGQFDVKWMNTLLKPELMNQKVYFEDDTLLKHYAQFPGATGDHGLKDLAQKLCGAPEWELDLKRYTVGGAYYERIPQYLLYSYNAADVYWTWKLDKTLQEWLDEGPEGPRQLLREVLLPISRMLVDIEDTDAGWPVDLALAEALQLQLKKLTTKQLMKIRLTVGDPAPYISEAHAKQRELWISKGRELREKDHEFNPSSPIQVGKWLTDQGAALPRNEPTKTNPIGSLKTDEETLEDFVRDGDPKPKVRKWVGKLLDYRHDSKMLSTYVEGMVLEGSRNGRAYPRYQAAKVVTGRLASPIHTLPRPVPGEPNYRAMFVCEPGEVIVGADYGQIEARIVAELTGDPQMIKDFQLDQPDFFARQLPGAYPAIYKNMDAVYRMQEIDNARYKAHRQDIKPFVHGGNYMRQAKAIAKQYGIPVADAQRMLDAYMNRYKMIRPWQEEVMDYVRGIETDPQWGVPGLWTPFGRRFQQGIITEKNGWSIKNAAVAYKPQSIGGDITVTAALDLHTGDLPRLNSRLVGLIHDAIYVIGPERHAEQLKVVIPQAMDRAAQKVFTRVPFPVEVHVGKSWADV